MRGDKLRPENEARVQYAVLLHHVLHYYITNFNSAD